MGLISKTRMAGSRLVLGAVALGLAAAAPPPTAEPDAAAHEAAAARKLAGGDLTAPLFLCEANSTFVLDLIKNHQNDWLPPTRVFDNLYFIGTRFVGVYVLKTSAGLILFDSGTSVAFARDEIAPRMKTLGLDPKDVRYVVVTHGHWDHFGGAPYWQDASGARIAASKADWRLMEKAPRDSVEIAKQPIPRHDLEIADGQVLTLGDASVTLYVTPGHTPGTVSAMIPVRDHGRTVVLSLLGGTVFPTVRQPNNRSGGQLQWEASIRRLAGLAERHHAVGLLNTHAFADGGEARMAALREKGDSGPNPFVIGTPAVMRYYAVVDHCVKAALARPENPASPIGTSFPED